MENANGSELFAIDPNGKHKVTQMIDKRHKERQHHLDVVHTLKQRTNEATENLDYFLDTFNQQARDIELNLANMDTPDKNTLLQRFDRTTKSVQQLQNYLSSSTLFLPDSVVKRNQRTISELVAQLDTSKTRMMPKKKFGFSAKTTALIPPPKNASTDNQTTTKPQLSVEWMIQNRANEEIQLDEEQVNGKDLTMNCLTNCLVRIVGHAGSLQLSNITNCLILCGPVARSVFVDNCTASTLAFGCQQFRLHSSRQCRIHMHVTCRGIIEDCHAISVAPYSFSYPAIEVDFVKADLDMAKNNWQDVADFNWLSADRPSPNWHMMDEIDWTQNWTQLQIDFRKENAIR